MARQRPGTANGIVFVLLEDEHGTINLIVPAEVYERHRLTVRTEPLMMAEGKLERLAGGRWRDQHPGRSGRADRRAGPHHSPRSRTSRCSTSRCAAGWPSRAQRDRDLAGDRGRGLPRGGSAGHELRIGTAAMRPWALASPMSRPPGSSAVRCPLRARRPTVRRVLGRARAGCVRPRRPRRPGAAGTSATEPATGRAGPWAWVLALIYVGFGIVLPVVFLIGNHNNANAQVGGIKLTAAEKNGRELFGQHCGAVPHAGRGQRGRQGGTEPRRDPADRSSWCCTRSQNGCLPEPAVGLARRRAWVRGRCRPTWCRASTRTDVAKFVAKVAGKE